MFPTIEKLKRKLEGIPNDVTYKLCQLVKTTGFWFKKLNKTPVFMESVAVAILQYAFLRRIWCLWKTDIKSTTGETRCGQNHMMTYAWQEKVAETLTITLQIMWITISIMDTYKKFLFGKEDSKYLLDMESMLLFAYS